MNIAFLPNLAGPDGIFILVIILMFFGAKKLPDLTRGMGEAVNRFAEEKQTRGRFSESQLDHIFIILLSAILILLTIALLLHKP